MQSVYFGVFLLAIGSLFYWAFVVDRKPDKYRHRMPFGFRTERDYRKRYGDKLPF